MKHFHFLSSQICFIKWNVFVSRLKPSERAITVSYGYGLKEEHLIDLLKNQTIKHLNSAELKHIYNATSSVMSRMLKLIYTHR